MLSACDSNRGTKTGVPSVLALLIPLLIALWPVWSWYILRMTDSSDEPLGGIALAAASVFLLREGRRQQVVVNRGQLIGAMLLLCAYSGLFHSAPPLLRATIGVSIITLLFINSVRSDVALGLLLVLSLPIISSLEFFLGYPLRLVLTQVVAALLRYGGGLDVTASGTLLDWGARSVAIDSPCSGVHMLWVGLFLVSLLSCIFQLNRRSSIRALGTALRLVLAGNILRATLLFYKESKLVALPEWTHEGIGLVIFCAVAGYIAAKVRRLARLDGDNARGIVSREISIAPAQPAFRSLFWGACAIAATVPYLAITPATGSTSNALFASPEWPVQLLDETLTPAPLTPSDEKFVHDFPGLMKKFTTTNRSVLVRWVMAPTRKLHPASDCYRGSGYTVHPLPITIDRDGHQWGCFSASKHSEFRRVCERIFDNDGREFTDVSAWYWNAVLGRSVGPWWAITVAE